jgi:hypothetical protein
MTLRPKDAQKAKGSTGDSGERERDFPRLSPTPCLERDRRIIFHTGIILIQEFH